MNVFVSWSGEKSGDVARAFGGWLPLVLHAVEPFVSSRDIRAGTRWQAEIAAELDSTEFGLICVTKENQDAEWLNFEAGALAKSVDSSRVVPLAIDLAPADIANPLGQFQAIRLNQSDVSELVMSMNESCPSPISEENASKAVEKWWPDLEKELTEIAERTYEEVVDSTPARSDRAILEEVLDITRGLSRAGSTGLRNLEYENVGDALQNVLVDAGYLSWSRTARADGRYMVELPKPPTAKVIQSVREIEDRLGVLIDLRVQDEPGTTGHGQQ